MGGIAHDQLVAYAQSLCLAAGHGHTAASKTHSGEMRVETTGALSFVAVGTTGASLASTKDVLSFALLQRIMGTGAVTKRGSGASGQLHQAISGAVGSDGSCAVSSLNLNYSDAGLFGFVAAAPAATAGKVVTAAVKALRSIKADEADVARAKAQLKADLLMAQESSANLIEELALQVLLNKGSVMNVDDVVMALEQISVADVSAAASQVASGKLAMGAIGNLGSTPFLDEL